MSCTPAARAAAMTGQLHVLRQVANVRAQRFNRPMVKNDTIYADAAMNWLPRAN